MNTSLIGLLGLLGTSFVSAWAMFKYVVLGTYRLGGDESKRLIDKINREAKWKWLLASEHVEEPKFPSVFEVIASLSGVTFYFSRSERLLTAGWQGKEDYSTISFLRWDRRKVDEVLRNSACSTTIPVAALSTGSPDRLGELTADPNAAVYLNSGSYEDIEEDVAAVARGDAKKTGFLLHGPPGNGKTQFVKYLARKYSLPIYVVYLKPDYDNYDIAKMFSEVPRRCIVLLEDFDNYFDGRECSMKNDRVRFTFDSIINAMDGVHNDYRGVVFAMTVNDLGKVDDSIKNRPSRFKFVREFGPPALELRAKILGSIEEAEGTEGLSLDKVFSRKR
jgi:hypothetical protein